MPHCCIPGCKSNYESVVEREGKKSLFGFPKDNDLKEKWLQAIPRKNFVPRRNSKVCEKHFTIEEIDKFDKYLLNGELTMIPCKARLKKNVVPSIFPISTCPLLNERGFIQERPEIKLENGTEQHEILDNQHSSLPVLIHKSECSSVAPDTKEPTVNTFYIPRPRPGKVVVIKKNGEYYKILPDPNIDESNMGPILIKTSDAVPMVMNFNRTRLKPQQSSLNLNTVQGTDRRRTLTAKEKICSDKKFCWTFNSFRIRDLEGFSDSDRLGFFRSEAERASKCERNLKKIIKKYEGQLNNTVYNYSKFKSQLINNDKVKLVAINKIINASKISVMKQESTSEFPNHLNPQPFPQIKVEELSSVVKNEDEAMEYDSDLLVAKKAVLYSENEEKQMNKVSKVNRQGVQDISKIKKSTSHCALMNEDTEILKEFKTEVTECYGETSQV